MKIAVVEDNDLLRKLIFDSLTFHFPSDEVLSFSDGESFLGSVDRFPLDFAVLDIHLPGKNGLEITHMIRNNCPDAIIIIYTNYDLPEYQEVAYKSGANFFLSKENNRPADLAQLIKAENM